MHTYKFECVRIVDGDTFIAYVDLGMCVHLRVPIRLARVNAPEKGQPGSDEATKLLTKLVLDRSGIVKTSKDRYGRYVGDVTVNGYNLSDKLIEHRPDLYTKYAGTM